MRFILGIMLALVAGLGCEQIEQVQEQVQAAQETVEQARSSVEQAQKQLAKAGEMAEFSMYYAQVGMKIGQVEEEYNSTVFPQLNAAAGDATQRTQALAAAGRSVERLTKVVEDSRPSANPEGHDGYQAARRMVARRQAALTKLGADWGTTADHVESSNHLITFSREWMLASTDWAAAVGQASQATFGGAAQGALQQAGQAPQAQGQAPPPQGPAQ